MTRYKNGDELWMRQQLERILNSGRTHSSGDLAGDIMELISRDLRNYAKGLDTSTDDQLLEAAKLLESAKWLENAARAVRVHKPGEQHTRIPQPKTRTR